MPSASLQSRIQAFEALSCSSSNTTSITTPSLSSQTSANSTPPSNLLESPISPTASTFHPIAPLVAPDSSNRSRSPSPSTPSLVSQTSLIDLKDWIIEDGPAEPPFAFPHSLIAGVGKLNGIRDSSRTPSPSSKSTPTCGASNSSAPLINLESPPKSGPPLPPRKLSYNTIDRVSTRHSLSRGSETGDTLPSPGRSDSLTVEHTYPPAAHKFGAGRVGHASTSSISSFHSVSLSSDGMNMEICSPRSSNKPPSFTFEADSTTTDVDTASIAESFEDVSASSAVSPSTTISFDWEQGISKPKAISKRKPPVPPNRSATKTAPVVPPKLLVRSVSASSSSTATSTKTRRPPPPPPPHQLRPRLPSQASVVSTSASTSDRSSILSNATTTSRTSISTCNSAQFGSSVKSSPLLRQAPVPPAAQLRYESLFDSALKGRQKAGKVAQKTRFPSPPPPSAKKGRQSVGWRGLSIDLIPSSEDHPISPSGKGLEEESSSEEEESSSVAPEEKLNGRMVKYIWSASRLDRQKLRVIWNECDPQCTGFVDRDAFVRGMWRIDEELRRAQLAQRSLALTTASSQRIPHRPLPPLRSQGTTQLLI